jgi:hypothetical protein
VGLADAAQTLQIAMAGVSPSPRAAGLSIGSTLPPLFGAVTAVGGGIVAWLVARRQRSGRIATSEAGDIWAATKTLVDNQQTEIGSLRSENASLRAENDGLRRDNARLTSLKERRRQP